MHRISITLLALVASVAVTGCRRPIAIYHSLSEPGAMKTCDANQRFRVEAEGPSEKAARHAGEAQIRDGVSTNKGCGAFISKDGVGAKLDGGYRYFADYQLCRCQ